jgi:hypothetical protein
MNALSYFRGDEELTATHELIPSTGDESRVMGAR